MSVLGRPVLRVGIVLTALLTSVLVVLVAEGSSSDTLSRCASFRAASLARVAATDDPDLLVIGDSWSVGLGLDDPGRAWPSVLPGRVRVAGFSGSGFSQAASPCGSVSYAERVGAALRGLPVSARVVVEGGLNDEEASDAEIRAGFALLVAGLDGHEALVVGPAAAPSRASAMVRIDALLGRLCARAGLTYLSTYDLRLDYLDDRLHLTEAGHLAFGRAVAAELAR